jgi:predicted molibdopterin-dependent oxidoreductase YjgC
VVEYTPSQELPDDKYPFMLSTGRHLFHYHTGTMIRKGDDLNSIAAEAYVELHSDDVKHLGIRNGEMIKVSSRRGSINIKARVSQRVGKGRVFIPFHYKEAAANILTNTALDPISKIPELKVCAVKLEKMKNKKIRTANFHT